MPRKRGEEHTGSNKLPTFSQIRKGTFVDKDTGEPIQEVSYFSGVPKEVAARLIHIDEFKRRQEEDSPGKDQATEAYSVPYDKPKELLPPPGRLDRRSPANDVTERYQVPPSQPDEPAAISDAQIDREMAEILAAQAAADSAQVAADKAQVEAHLAEIREHRAAIRKNEIETHPASTDSELEAARRAARLAKEELERATAAREKAAAEVERLTGDLRASEISALRKVMEGQGFSSEQIEKAVAAAITESSQAVRPTTADAQVVTVPDSSITEISSKPVDHTQVLTPEEERAEGLQEDKPLSRNPVPTAPPEVPNPGASVFDEAAFRANNVGILPGSLIDAAVERVQDGKRIDGLNGGSSELNPPKPDDSAQPLPSLPEEPVGQEVVKVTPAALAVQEEGLSVDSKELSDVLPIPSRSRLDRKKENLPQQLDRDLDIAGEKSHPDSTQPISHESGKNVPGVISDLAEMAKSQFTGLSTQQVKVIAFFVFAFVAFKLVSGGDSNMSEACKTPQWAEHTISAWTKDCELASTDHRTVVKAGGVEYNLMARAPQGLKPQSIPYVLMMLSSGGKEDYTQPQDHARGLIPQSPARLAEATKEMGLKLESVTEVRGARGLRMPNHTTSWLIGAWSINKSWSVLAQQPKLRTEYSESCRKQGVEPDIELGYDVTLCQLLMHFLPKPWTTPSTEKGKPSYVKAFVDLVVIWGNPGAAPTMSIQADLKRVAERGNERACLLKKIGQPSLITGQNCQQYQEEKK